MDIFLSKAKASNDFTSGLREYFFDNDEVVIFDLNLFHRFKRVHHLYDSIAVEKALSRPDYALVLLSSAYIKDEWLMAELNSLFTLEQNRKTQFVIPVLTDDLSNDEIPRYLIDSKSDIIDVRNKTSQEGVSIVAGYISNLALNNRRVFIGHGRSQAWHGLKDLLINRFYLPYDEFGREPRAGISTQVVLMTMLDGAKFAFLVMTAEDEHGDNKLHARQNVIHEIGLFQGRLGYEKAIILLEEGCAEFSNITGLTYIPFPKGNIKAVSEDIWAVLKRERLVF
jgi:predicted nucleotide-binding protein